MKRWDYTTSIFSPCRTWRYILTRSWDEEKPNVMFIGLNPSTADEEQDDPTVRRCINFAHAWGFGSMTITNIFGFRATDPKVMKAADDPIGPNNMAWICRVAPQSQLIVAAWGNHGYFREQGTHIKDTLVYMDLDLMCLGVTKEGHPKHPLYLRGDSELIKF